MNDSDIKSKRNNEKSTKSMGKNFVISIKKTYQESDSQHKIIL